MDSPQDPKDRFAHVPAELKSCAKWLVVELSPDPQRPGKSSKVPVHPVTGRRADCNDPGAQLPFDKAAALVGERKDRVLGFVPKGTPFFARDWDDARGADGLPKPAVAALLKASGSYVELSPSGRGFREVLRRSDPEWHSPKGRFEPRPVGDGAMLEVLAAGFFTVTGDAPEGQEIVEMPLAAAVAHWESLPKLAEGAVGGRNSELARYAGQLAKKGLSAEEAKALVRVKNSSFAEPLPDAELESTVFKSIERWSPAAHEPDGSRWREFLSPLSTWRVEPTKEIVQDLLRSKCVHAFAGIFESYKSMFALELCAAVRQGRKACGHFEVNRAEFGSPEVVFLCPDMSPELFLEYAKNFGLHTDAGFIGIAPGQDVFVAVDSPLLAAAVAGRILVLDTMLDYAGIKDAFQSGEWVVFFRKLRALVDEAGALAVLLIAHPTKTGAKSSSIDPVDFLKDSVTFGGKLDVGFAFRKVDKTALVYVERIKGRGWKRPVRFTVATHDETGDSNISRGCFPVHHAPGDCPELAELLASKRPNGRPPDPKRADLARRILEMSKRGMSKREIAAALNMKESTVYDWLKKAKEDEKQQGMW